ncbi:hypothetical protein IFR05_010278 [Cadophora sp. M221]|nr:hypothetical protein IFR05_010278 [Cadophora sp. M221]
MSKPSSRPDFWLRFNGRTTKRVVDLGSSIEKARPRPNPLVRGPCPQTYHLYLLENKIVTCHVCMVYTPHEQEERRAELAQQERVRAWLENETKKAVEWEPKAISGEEQSSVDSDEESEEPSVEKKED